MIYSQIIKKDHPKRMVLKQQQLSNNYTIKKITETKKTALMAVFWCR